MGPRALLALRQRTPLARRFANGQILVSAGSEMLTSQDGERFRPVQPGYRAGSWQLCADAGRRMAAFSYANLEWDPGASSFQSTCTFYASPDGAEQETCRFVVHGLPGESDWTWIPQQAQTYGDYFYVSVCCIYREKELWRGRSVTNATLCSAHLLRTVAPGVLKEFKYLGEIASRTSLPRIESRYFPLYYGAEPAFIVLNEQRIVALVRTTADDDDSARKLDPAAIFDSQAEDFRSRAAVILGREAVPGVWEPALEPRRYYHGEKPEPPIALAVSEDGGVTWRRRLLGNGGVTPALAYDSGRKLLVTFYGGLVYPRRGHAFQFSADGGQNWSEPCQLPDAEDGRTTGTVSIIALGQGRFVLFYDLLPGYIQLLPGRSDQDFSTYSVYSRIIRISE